MRAEFRRAKRPNLTPIVDHYGRQHDRTRTHDPKG
jgi:hypothetical protein